MKFRARSIRLFELFHDPFHGLSNCHVNYSLEFNSIDIKVYVCSILAFVALIILRWLYTSFEFATLGTWY
ncbi:hypothetical protein HanRHA438_Chr17g0816921 [Helianthus annuus]|nr:hypothetical protein HanRHA438_Chr17g0816921 [Helianthus annuus]